MAEEKNEAQQSPREIIEKLTAMSDAEFSQFMHWHFEQLCKRPIAPHNRAEGEA